jgi:pimeloyl-ACP methyl ester carboxylesterase
VWLGHSIGCNAVAHLARLRPDVIREAMYVGPLWTRTRYPSVRIFAMLALDALREPLGLYRYVLPAYWRIGVARWLATWRRYAADVTCAPPPGVCLAGGRDPIPDRTCTPTITVPGAHACVFSHPAALASSVSGVRPHNAT